MQKKLEKVRNECGLKASWENSVTWEGLDRNQEAGPSRSGTGRAVWPEERQLPLEGWAHADRVEGADCVKPEARQQACCRPMRTVRCKFKSY